jgi:hypothetical protein
MFPAIRPDIRGRWSGHWSKWFGRYRRTIGLDKRCTELHSSQYSWKAAATAAHITKRHHDETWGHEASSGDRSYGSAPIPKPLLNSIEPAFSAGTAMCPGGVDLAIQARALDKNQVIREGTPAATQKFEKARAAVAITGQPTLASLSFSEASAYAAALPPRYGINNPSSLNYQPGVNYPGDLNYNPGVKNAPRAGS